MADRIKGLKIVLGADTSQLTDAIYKVNTAISKTMGNLRDVNKALKLDPGNTELLKDKQIQLSDAITETKDKLKSEQEALDALKSKGVDETSQEFKNLKTQIDIDNATLKDLENQMKEFGSVSAQQLKAVGDKFKDVGQKMKEVGDKISSVGSRLTTTFTVPIVAAGAKATMSFAEVDKTMQLTNATMGNTADEANLLNDAMEKAASNSTFGMNDAANATLNFARAGLNAKQAANALAPAMNLAAGEAGDLNTVSAGLTATINGFGDTFEQAEKYADVFAAACNNSALDVNSLSEAMSIAAPIFATAGKDVEDAALYMGIMANAGIDANTAANSLKTGMARLAEPTKQAREAMEKYGIAMSDIWNEDGSMKDSVTIQNNLHDAFARLTEQEQMSAAGAIFGKNQMASWLALINTAPADVDALSQSIQNSTGTTQEMADAMMSGFGGSIEKLKSSLDVLMTSIGQIIAEYLTPIIEKIQGVVDAFMALDDETKQHIVQIAAVIAAVGPVLVIVGKVITFIGGVITAIGTITSAIGSLMGIITAIGTFITGTIIPALGALLSPIGLIVAAIAAVIAIIVVCINHWDEIKEVASKVADTIQQKWEQFKEKMSQLWSQIMENIKNKVDQIKTNTINAFENIKNTVTNKVSSLKTKAVEIFTNLHTSIQNTVGNIKNSIIEGFNNAIAFITSLPAQAIGWGADIINGIVEGIHNTIGKITDAVSGIAETISSYIHFSVPDKGPLRDFRSYMPDMINEMVKGIDNGIPQIASAMQSLSGAMIPQMGASGATNNENISNVINLSVYGAQGQNINELADVIEGKITENMIRRGAAFG